MRFYAAGLSSLLLVGCGNKSEPGAATNEHGVHAQTGRSKGSRGKKPKGSKGNQGAKPEAKSWVDEIESCKAKVALAFDSLQDDTTKCGTMKFSPEPGVKIDFDFRGADRSYDPDRFITVIDAQDREDIDEFCRLKIPQERISRAMGLLDVIEIPESAHANQHCRKIVSLAYGRKKNPVVLDWQAWNQRAPWTLEILANLIRLLELVHKEGFAIKRLEFEVLTKGSKQTWKLASLDPLPPLSAKHTVQGDLKKAEGIIESVVAERGTNNRLQNSWTIEKTDPLVVLLNTIRKFQPDSGTSFDYRGIIAVLEGKETRNVEIDLKITPQVTKWWNQFELCLAEGKDQVAECSEAVTKCGPGHTYQLEADPVTIEEQLEGGAGETAQVFKTSQAEVLQKLVSTAKSCTEGVYIACSERTSLAVLDGLEGTCPKTFQIKAAPEKMCKSLSVFMGLVPGISVRAWFSTGKVSHQQAMTYLQSIVWVLQKLHRAGFVHNDNHASNVFVDPNTGTPRLIDFGFARPLVDRSGKPLFWGLKLASIRNDLAIALASVGDFANRLKTSANLRKAYETVYSLGAFENGRYDELVALLEAAKRE
jgi:hypothetical protein